MFAFNSIFMFSFLSVFESSSFHRLLNEFDEFNIHIDFCSISQIPDPSFVRKNCCIAFISLLDSWRIINVDLTKYDIIIYIFGLFYIAGHVLRFYLDSVVLVFLYYFLYIHFQKSVERGYLLWYQTVLFEICTNYCPGIILIDFISVLVIFSRLEGH